MNFGAFEALILISLPVTGLRPVLVARFATSNVPTPINWITPFFQGVVITSMEVTITLYASDLQIPTVEAIVSIYSVLFMRDIFIFLLINLIREDTTSR